jgi:hypothetical protein
MKEFCTCSHQKLKNKTEDSFNYDYCEICGNIFNIVHIAKEGFEKEYLEL